MKSKTLIAIIISLFVGIIFKFYIGDYKTAPDTANQIAVLLGGGVGFLIWVIALPLLISLVIFIKNKQFPHSTFASMTYVILVILTVISFIGQWNLKSIN